MISHNAHGIAGGYTRLTETDFNNPVVWHFRCTRKDAWGTVHLIGEVVDPVEQQKAAEFAAETDGHRATVVDR